MRTFKDPQNREWTIAITTAEIRRVLAAFPDMGINLADVDRPRKDAPLDDKGKPLPLLTEISIDILLQAEIILCLLGPQMEKRGLTEETLGVEWQESDTHIEAIKAFWGALSDFFQRVGRRELARMVEKNQAMISAGIDLAEKQMAAVDAEGFARAAFSSSATSSEESAELTPDPIPSES